MKILVIILLSFSMSNLFAQYSEKQVRDILEQVINEEVKDANLKIEYERILADFLRKAVFSQRRISEITKTLNNTSVKNQDEAFKIGFSMAMSDRDKSIKFLSNRDLYDLMMLNVSILSLMSDFECSQYIKRRNTQEGGRGRSIYGIAGGLDLEKFKNYFAIYAKALKNMEGGKNESQFLMENDILKVKKEYQRLFNNMLDSDNRAKEFLKSGKSFSNAGDNDVCSVGKSLIGLIVKGGRESSEMRINAYISGRLN